MSDDRPIFTRRQFLRSSLALASTATTMPLFLHQAAMAMEQDQDGQLVQSRPGSQDERILVVVELTGGNDGLNTVIPFGEDRYYRARPTLSLSPAQVLQVDQDSGVGLHPSLRAMQEMMDQGLAGIVQGVGYPNPNLSHFTSMDIWNTGDPQRPTGLGWIGRALDEMAQERPEDFRGSISIGSRIPLALQSSGGVPTSFSDAQTFRWVGEDRSRQLTRRYEALNLAASAAGAGTGEEDVAAFVRRTSMNAQVESDRLRKAMDQGDRTRFPYNALANQLQDVAAMIRAELPTRVYYVSFGDFDTHAHQKNTHAQLLEQFAQAIQAFYGELEAIGHADRVLTLAFSEFGRRVYENGSAGTDHGAAAPVFLFGPMVQAGLIGAHPEVPPDARGNLGHLIDFRQVYATVIDDWLGVDSVKTLRGPFEKARVLDLA